MAYRITIDVRKSVSGNAEFCYEAAKRAKQKLAGAKRALEDTRKKIEELEKKEITRAKAVPELQKVREKRWFDKFHSFNSSDGFFVVGGKDATTNEILIKKHLENRDVVFHADIQGAPFFVIKNPGGGSIPERALMETAQAAASYSKAWKLGLGSCDVYYVKPEQVSKQAPSGEYVAKGAFMIHGKKEWFRGVRLEIAVGFRVIDEAEVLSGPPGAIEAGSSYCVRLTAGDVKSEELAREIKAIILQKAKKDDAEKIRKVRLDEIQRLIPGGKGRIIK